MRRKDTAKRSLVTSIMQNRRKRKTAIGVISVVLVLAVIAVLILPAIAMEDDSFCGLEEHTHNESCYQRVLDCELEEGKDHQHDERCYQSVLVCDKTEHRHSLACYSDPKADVETSDDWERSMEHIDTSDADGAVLAAVAQSQLGYKESKNNYTVINDSEMLGYTRYGAWYGDPYAKWSGLFVAFCIHYAGITDYPTDADCNDWADKLRQAELFYEPHEAQPQVGDLVFLNTEAGERADRIGVITDIEEGEDGFVSFKSVEGIPSEGVQQNEHTTDDAEVLGFGLLPGHKEALTQKEEDTILLSANTDTDLLVTVKAKSSAFEGAGDLSLSAAEPVGKDIDQNMKGYIDLIKEKAESKEMQNPVFRVLNVEVTAENKSLMPLEPVQLAFGGLGQSKLTSVYSLADGSAEKVELSASEDSTVVFDSNKLGSFIIISDVYSQNKSTHSTGTTPSGEETTSLKVNINWEDGKYAHQNDTVTLKLLKNGKETGETAEVTADDKWTHTFTGLEMPEDNADFAYSVKEEVSDQKNLEVTVSEPKKVEASDADTYWLPSKNNELKDKETYALVSNGYMLSNDNGALSAVKASVGGAEVVDNKQYTSSLTDVSKAAQWRINEADGGLLANNKGSYITTNGKCDVSENNSAAISVSDQKLVLDNNSDADTISISKEGMVSVTATDDASDFDVYRKVELAPVSAHYVQEISATGAEADLSPTGMDLILKKYIDYLGDNGNNPDTSVKGKNLYRLYLEAKGYTEPMDLLVILDASSSMTKVDMPMYGENQKRLVVEDAILNGTIISGDPNSAYGRANAIREFDGLTAQFLSSHPQNRIAVTAYAGGQNDIGSSYEEMKDRFNRVQLNWTTISGIPNGGLTAKDFYTPVMLPKIEYGTNYVSGLMFAQEMLDDPIVKNDGRKKHVLFLTDGYPNIIIDNDGYISDSYVQKNTIDYFEQFHANNPGVDISVVGISPEATSGNAYNLLSTISNKVEGEYYLANDFETFKDALFSVVDHCSSVRITDELSDYVDFYGSQPDIVVTMENGFTNEKVVLWENGAETENNILANNQRIINSVGYVAGDGTDHGSVKLELDPSYKLNGDNRFTVSFNVEISDEAIETFMNSGYIHVGDENTDYVGNTTSSGQDGFHSNSSAYASFEVSGEEFTKYYPHPVVQVEVPEYDIIVNKLETLNNSPLNGAVFDVYRIVTDLSASSVEIPGSGGLKGVKLQRTLISDDNGKIEINGLAPGEYALVETKAPDGFNLLTSCIKFAVAIRGAVTSNDVTIQNNELVVYNEVYYELPHTGGVGRTGYYAIGLSLLMLTLVMIYIKHRRGGLFSQNHN
ncbi:SpaA isopeptide-forming pilin-related protein [Ruminococcus sp.]|uniref:DUF7604 domain-containing protein n=1 Tax=Ruminococcus sp. TaxID=41978 RepID=UPI00388DFE8D